MPSNWQVVNSFLLNGNSLRSLRLRHETIRPRIGVLWTFNEPLAISDRENRVLHVNDTPYSFTSTRHRAMLLEMHERYELSDSLRLSHESEALMWEWLEAIADRLAVQQPAPGGAPAAGPANVPVLAEAGPADRATHEMQAELMRRLRPRVETVAEPPAPRPATRRIDVSVRKYVRPAVVPLPLP